MGKLHGKALDEDHLIRVLNDMINAGHPSEAVRLIKNGSAPLSWSKTVSLALKSDTINDFFESNAELNVLWAERLNGLGYLDCPIPRTDGRSVQSVFARYKGACLWSVYDRMGNKDSEDAHATLSTACECNIYDAWIERISRLRIVCQEKGTPESTENLVRSLNRFSESFWSAGYLLSGIVLLEVAGHFKNRDDREGMAVCLQAAIESLYVGFYLMDDPVSQSIIDSIYQGDGWMRIFEDYDNGWEAHDASAVENHMIRAIEQNFEITGPEIFFLPLAKSAAEKAEQIRERVSRVGVMEHKL